MLTSDAPPWLMNGSGMPVTGRRPITIPTFTNTWNRSIDARPAPNSVPNGSRDAPGARRGSATAARREQQEHDEGPDEAQLLGEDREHEVALLDRQEVAPDLRRRW